MDYFDKQIEIRTIGRTHGYNHEIWIKTIDETLLGEGYDDMNRSRTEALASHLFDRDGIGGARVQSVTYKGVVGEHPIENPYAAGKFYDYKVHRSEVVIRVSGTD